MKNKIIQIKEQIDKVDAKLFCDKWEEAQPEIVSIFNELQTLLDMISKLQSEEIDMTEVQNKWLVLIDAILKAFEMRDTIQLADLFHYDLVQALNYIEENF